MHVLCPVPCNPSAEHIRIVPLQTATSYRASVLPSCCVASAAEHYRVQLFPGFAANTLSATAEPLAATCPDGPGTGK